MRDLILKGVETQDELRLANDLMARVQCLDTFDGLRWLTTCGAQYPGFRREHTRIAVLRGEVGAALRITTNTVRIGEARLKTGGLGWVTTAGYHRHKGVALALLNDTMHYLKAQNYHVSMLFGIPNFYHHFGFATTLAEYATTVPLNEAFEITAAAYKVRKGKPGDIPAIQRIHNENDGGVACSALRSGAHITNRWEEWKAVRVLTNARGKVFAYFLPRAGEDEFVVAEVGVAHWQSCASVLHASARLASEEHASRLRFAGPPSHPFIQFLLQYKSTHEMRCTQNRGGMMAFVNLDETLESMIPEWESRLMRSAARVFRTECTLLVDRKPYRVRANKGAIDVASMSGLNKVSLTTAELIHLVAGYRYCDEILSSKRRIINAEGRALLAALFPKRTPYVWAADRF